MELNFLPEDEIIMHAADKEYELSVRAKAIINGNQSFQKLLALDVIANEDLDILDGDELADFYNLIEMLLLTKEGEELDEFLCKVDTVMMPSSSERLYERNQARITWAVNVLTGDIGRVPTVAEIADKTRLCRATIYNHMNETPVYLTFGSGRYRQSFMKKALLESMLARGIKGDVKAAKLYFERSDKEEVKEELMRKRDAEATAKYWEDYDRHIEVRKGVRQILNDRLEAERVRNQSPENV